MLSPFFVVLMNCGTFTFAWQIIPLIMKYMEKPNNLFKTVLPEDSGLEVLKFQCMLHHYGFQ